MMGASLNPLAPRDAQRRLLDHSDDVSSMVTIYGRADTDAEMLRGVHLRAALYSLRSVTGDSP